MKRIFVFILAMAMYLPALSQTAEEITLSYSEFAKESDWVAIAGLYDPADLKAFRDSMSLMDEYKDDQYLSAVFMVFGQNIAPDCARDIIKDDDARKQCMLSVRDTLKSWDDAEYLAHTMNKAGRRPRRARAAKNDSTAQPAAEILGKVYEADSSQCHVVYRDGDMTSNLKILSLKTTKDGWKLVMDQTVLRKIDIVKRFKNYQKRSSGSKKGKRPERRPRPERPTREKK